MTTTTTDRRETAIRIARAAGIAPRTKRFWLLDHCGNRYDGMRYEHVLAALSRSDKTPDLSQRVHTVAYALSKSMTSGRMPAESMMRIAAYSPYRLCALVARIAVECPETTVGGICDVWLAKHHQEL